MSQKADEKRNTLYANLMDEVKVRISCIELALQGRLECPTPIVREFCYLQLRMLCELIVLGCLVAHGDIAMLQAHKVGKSYSADEILDRMAKLRPHFFPQAVTQTLVGKTLSGVNHFKLTGMDPQPMTREDLLRLYGDTHKFLHRGSLKKLLSPETPIDLTINVPEIVSWLQKIGRLLSSHLIAISENRFRSSPLP